MVRVFLDIDWPPFKGSLLLVILVMVFTRAPYYLKLPCQRGSLRFVAGSSGYQQKVMVTCDATLGISGL